MPYYVGVDTGGTFTDFVYESGGELRVFKIASTPDDPSRAIVAGLQRIVGESGARTIEVVHGTTVGTNALLQRRGARVALTGSSVSPPLFDCMEIYGKDVTLARLRA